MPHPRRHGQKSILMFRGTSSGTAVAGVPNKTITIERVMVYGGNSAGNGSVSGSTSGTQIKLGVTASDFSDRGDLGIPLLVGEDMTYNVSAAGMSIMIWYYFSAAGAA